MSYSRAATFNGKSDDPKYVFLSKGKVYEIENQDLKDLEQHAGHTVKLTGNMSSDGKTIKAARIFMSTSARPVSGVNAIANTASSKDKGKIPDSSGTDSTQATHGGKTPPAPR